MFEEGQDIVCKCSGFGVASEIKDPVMGKRESEDSRQNPRYKTEVGEGR